MNYRYRAMTQDGQKLQGIIDANDERQARLRLREEGLFLLDIRPQKSSGVKTRRPRISHSELTLFTRQLATLSAAALPLEESLAVIGQQSSNKRLGDVLNQVRSAILEGHPLSDALQHFPTLFDSLYRTLVKAGEKSGLLAPVLEKLADYNENRQKIRSKLIQSLIYPCMLTTVAIGVVIILLTAVVPKITEQFVHMKQQLPLSNQLQSQDSFGEENTSSSGKELINGEEWNWRSDIHSSKDGTLLERTITVTLPSGQTTSLTRYQSIDNKSGQAQDD
ncbi:type II secretion system minor pseudopilin GspI [Escherichia coli]|nr:type II secretion system minor pseudopilin GspI [Escherichia coli]EHC1624416.1 type II secretion system minor pseudopilin GspI [Escherichia coli]